MHRRFTVNAARPVVVALGTWLPAQELFRQPVDPPADDPCPRRHSLIMPRTGNVVSAVAWRRGAHVRTHLLVNMGRCGEPGYPPAGTMLYLVCNTAECDGQDDWSRIVPLEPFGASVTTARLGLLTPGPPAPVPPDPLPRWGFVGLSFQRGDGTSWSRFRPWW